jgi:hypothetical protein
MNTKTAHLALHAKRKACGADGEKRAGGRAYLVAHCFGLSLDGLVKACTRNWAAEHGTRHAEAANGGELYSAHGRSATECTAGCAAL